MSIRFKRSQFFPSEVKTKFLYVPCESCLQQLLHFVRMLGKALINFFEEGIVHPVCIKDVQILIDEGDDDFSDRPIVSFPYAYPFTHVHAFYATVPLHDIHLSSCTALEYHVLQL